MYIKHTLIFILFLNLVVQMEPTTSEESSEPPIIYPNLKQFNKANPVPKVAPEGLLDILSHCHREMKCHCKLIIHLYVYLYFSIFLYDNTECDMSPRVVWQLASSIRILPRLYMVPVNLILRNYFSGVTAV